MTKLEFKQFLGSYKQVNEIAKKIVYDKYDGWDYLSFHISNGRIFAEIWSGEDVHNMPDAIQERDITKEILAELMPDDLIF